MKKLFGFLGILSMMLFFASCKTTADKLTFSAGDNGTIIVKKGDKPYSGDFWSPDKKTIKMTTNENGLLQVFVFYYNDQVACSISQDGEGNISTAEFYDKEGKPIDGFDFELEYADEFKEAVRSLPKELGRQL